MGYLLQLLGVPLLIAGFFMTLNGVLSINTDPLDIASVVWGGVGVLLLLVGFAFLREGRRKLRASGDLKGRG